MAEIGSNKGKISILSHVAYSICFSALILFCSILQCSNIELFGILPDVTFATVCAIGFIAKEKYGAIFGLFGGVMIMALGSGGLSLTPVLFTLCGYLSGALPEVILRRNFLSYLVFTVMMGAIHIFFTLIYYVLVSQSYEIWNVIGKQMIPELFSCIICMIFAYFAVLGIYTLFKGKDNRRGRVR